MNPNPPTQFLPVSLEQAWFPWHPNKDASILLIFAHVDLDSPVPSVCMIFEKEEKRNRHVSAVKRTGLWEIGIKYYSVKMGRLVMDIGL